MVLVLYMESAAEVTDLECVFLFYEDVVLVSPQALRAARERIEVVAA